MTDQKNSSGLYNRLRAEISVFSVVLGMIVVISSLFIIQHWNEFQEKFFVPVDTSALVRVFIEQPIMLGFMRSASVVLLLLLLFALAIVLYKIMLATEVKTKAFELKTKTGEIEEIAQSQTAFIEELKSKIEELQLQNLIKDIVKSKRKE